MSKYPYTLQPIPFALTADEQRAAQLGLFKASNTISTKAWLIIAAVVAAAIAGLIFASGYSTILFWLMLVGVALFLLARTVGLTWYFKKQMQNQPVQNISGIKMGVQPQGLIMVQRMGQQEGRAVIEWKDMTEWRETNDYLFVFYTTRGQQGTHVIPKSFAAKKFPVETVKKHLQETLGNPATGSMTAPS